MENHKFWLKIEFWFKLLRTYSGKLKPKLIKSFKVKIDKNIKWRADNQAEIVKYINNRENDGENNAQMISTSTMMLATVLALN